MLIVVLACIVCHLVCFFPSVTGVVYFFCRGQSDLGEVVRGDRDVGGGRDEGLEPLPRANREDRAGRDGE